MPADLSWSAFDVVRALSGVPTMIPQKPILFLGDPHMDFATIKAAAASYEVPGTIVCVGDFELPSSIRSPEIFGALFAAGWEIRYVIGNHDSDTCQQFNYLIGEKGGHSEGNLHGRGVDVGVVRIAGLGGVFKGRIWLPGEEARYESRADWLRRNPERWRGGLPLHLADAIFPEDFERMGRMRADVLVCHEGPSSVHRDMGWQAIDDLAASMRATWIVHGHHHHLSETALSNGVRVKALGIAEVWEFP